MPNEIAYYDDENGNRSYFADDTAREQIATKRSLTVSSSVIGSGVNVAGYKSSSNTYITPHEGFVRFTGEQGHLVCLVLNGYSAMVSSGPSDYKAIWLPKGAEFFFADGTPGAATWFNCSNE